MAARVTEDTDSTTFTLGNVREDGPSEEVVTKETILKVLKNLDSHNKSYAQTQNYYCHQCGDGESVLSLNNPDPRPIMKTVYGPLDEEKKLCKVVITEKMPTKCLLHCGCAFLVLDQHSSPDIKDVTKDELISSLKNGGALDPLVNIKFICGRKPHNTAIFFNGKNHRYYIHVEDEGLSLKPVPLPIHNDDDWRNHLQFMITNK